MITDEQLMISEDQWSWMMINDDRLNISDDQLIISDDRWWWWIDDQLTMVDDQWWSMMINDGHWWSMMINGDLSKDAQQDQEESQV